MTTSRRVRQPGIPNRRYSADEVERAVRMSVEGESDPAIAKVLGRPLASVRGLLDRTGIPGLRCNGQCHGLRLCLPETAHDTLAAEAARRALAPAKLAERLLTIVARDTLFRALLDG